MTTKGEQFAGLTVALITPFKNGEVDYERLTGLVDWHVEQGTDCLAPVGTTGESPTLDHEEHERVMAAVAERVRGRIKVMPGTGSNSTREAIRLTQFAALCDLTILSGDDSLTLPLMSIGGKGVVSVVGNIVPRDMKAMVKAFAAGQTQEALRWHQKLFPLCRDMLGVATNPIPIKTAMKLLGQDSGELRLPMCGLDSAGESKIRQTLREYGLLS